MFLGVESGNYLTLQGQLPIRSAGLFCCDYGVSQCDLSFGSSTEEEGLWEGTEVVLSLHLEIEKAWWCLKQHLDPDV